MMEQCSATIEVTGVGELGMVDENVFFKVTEPKNLMGPNPCPFLKRKVQYEARIYGVYKGKYLRVPALKPGHLKKGDTLKVQAMWSDRNSFITWTFAEEFRKLPKETSFQSNYIK